MRILFDLSSAQPQGNVVVNGGGEYAFSLLVEFYSFITEKSADIRIDVIFDGNKGTNKKVREFLDNQQISDKDYKNLTQFSQIVNEGTYNLLICPIMYPYYNQLQINDDIVVVGLIHDLSNFYHNYLTNNYGEFIAGDIRDVIRNAKKRLLAKRNRQVCLKEHEKLFYLNANTHIFTVSYFTYYAMKYFLPNCKVEGVHYSILKKVEHDALDEDAFLQQIGVDKKGYFMMSSCSRWAKNNLRVAECIDELISSGICEEIGRKKVIMLGCNRSVKNYLKNKLRNLSNFVLLDYVSDSELETLYEHAYTFIYPSLLEGFGVPPIEAMKHGVLSICSTSTSIPEICGNAVLYFDPYDNDAIKMALLKTFDQDIYQMKQEEGKKRLQELNDKQIGDMYSLFHKIEEFVKAKS